MRLQHQWWSGLVAAVLGGLVSVTAVAAAGEQFLPVLGVREGGQRFMMIPRADGFIAYLTLLNERDGGINGVTLVWEECETVFDVDRTVECYERLKAKGPTGAAVMIQRGTAMIYALTERAMHDQIPLFTVGYGRSDAADGRVFPYVFNPPNTYWSQNTTKIRFIGQRVGGMEQLKGLKIAHVHKDDVYGRETIPLLDIQAARYGFTVQHLPVQAPGLDQKAIWLRVKVAQPDWVILRTTGDVMALTALKEAALVGVPPTRWWGRHRSAQSSPWCWLGRRPWASSVPPGIPSGRHFPVV
jgi:branched-chain amino acid transport system substrate-binding protein